MAELPDHHHPDDASQSALPSLWDTRQRTCTSATAQVRLKGRSTSRRRSPFVVGSNSKSYVSPTEISCRASRSTTCAGGRSAPSFATARQRTGADPASKETTSPELFGVILMKRRRYFTPAFKRNGSSCALPFRSRG